MIRNMFIRKSRKHSFRVRCHERYLSLDFTWSVSIIVFCVWEKIEQYIFDWSIASYKNCKCMCQKYCVYFWPQIEKLLKTMEKFFEIKFANSYKNEYKWINIGSFKLILVLSDKDLLSFIEMKISILSLYSVDDGFTAKNFINGLFMQNNVCELRTKFRNLDSKIMQYVYKCS